MGKEVKQKVTNMLFCFFADNKRCLTIRDPCYLPGRTMLHSHIQVHILNILSKLIQRFGAANISAQL